MDSGTWDNKMQKNELCKHVTEQSLKSALIKKLLLTLAYLNTQASREEGAVGANAQGLCDPQGVQGVCNKDATMQYY